MTNGEPSLQEQLEPSWGDKERVAAELRQRGQARTAWVSTYVDLFFADTEFHDSMARLTRVLQQAQ